MRICSLKATNKIIEMQSDATPGTLLQNAVNAGYNHADIEERVVNSAEYEVIRAADPEDQKKQAIKLMQAHMDVKAQSYGYDNILSAVSYATSTVAKFQAEGKAFNKWRDDVWTYGLALLDVVKDGTNTITTAADLIASLPMFPLDS